MGRAPAPDALSQGVRALGAPADTGTTVWRSLAESALSGAGTTGGCTRASTSSASTRRSSSDQIEFHFSILAGKALTPSHFASLDEFEQRVLGFQTEFRKTAPPFAWTFHPPRPARPLDRRDQRGRLGAAA